MALGGLIRHHMALGGLIWPYMSRYEPLIALVLHLFGGGERGGQGEKEETSSNMRPLLAL